MVLHEKIRQYVFELNCLMELFDQLYSEKCGRVSLLNSVAPAFFGFVQRPLWEQLLIGICRVTEDKGCGDKEKLTLDSVVREYRSNPNARKRTELETIWKGIRREREVIRQYRNKRIGHISMKHAMDPIAEPLPDVALARVRSIIRDIEDLMNTIEMDLTGVERSYEPFPPQSVPQILDVATSYLRFRNLQTAAWKSSANEEHLGNCLRDRGRFDPQSGVRTWIAPIEMATNSTTKKLGQLSDGDP